MSRNEWEKGDFVIPAAEWPNMKSKVRDAHNKAQEARYALALKIHAHLTKNRDTTRKDPHRAAWDYAETLPGYKGTYFSPATIREDDVYAAVTAVVRDGKVRKPLKKEFPSAGNNVTAFNADDCTITFDNETRTVKWRVHENNHARERARGTAIAKALFGAMRLVKWTRGSGGSVYGNDEYNQDCGREYEGGGGSYHIESFGPKDENPGRTVRGFKTTSDYLAGSTRFRR